MTMSTRLPRAYVLTGGLGLRLRSVVGAHPKTLALVKGRPFLAYVIDQLVSQGVDDLTLCTGYGSAEVRAAIGEGSVWGISIAYSEEERPLGTGGALRAAFRRRGETAKTALLVNGDSYFAVDLAEMISVHAAMQADLTLALHWSEEAERFGTVAVEGGRVIQFGEKSSKGPGLVNGGIYVIRPSIVDRLPAADPASIERDLIPLLVDDSAVVVAGVRSSGYFVDIGIPSDYARVARSVPPSMLVQLRGRS